MYKKLLSYIQLYKVQPNLVYILSDPREYTEGCA